MGKKTCHSLLRANITTRLCACMPGSQFGLSSNLKNRTIFSNFEVCNVLYSLRCYMTVLYCTVLPVYHRSQCSAARNGMTTQDTLFTASCCCMLLLSPVPTCSVNCRARSRAVYCWVLFFFFFLDGRSQPDLTLSPQAGPCANYPETRPDCLAAVM